MSPAEPPVAGFLEVPGVLWARLDVDGRVRQCSPTAQSVLGRSPAELIGSLAVVLVHPGDLPVVAEAAARVRQGTDVTGVELRLAHTDGTWRHVVGAGRQLEDGHIDVVARVIDSAVRPAGPAEQPAGPAEPVGLGAVGETLVRALLERTPTPMLAFDLDGRVRFANYELCRLIGVTSTDDLIGQPVSAHPWPAALAGQPDEVSTVELATPTGVCRRFVVVRRVVRDGDDRPQAVTAVAVDITDRVAAEAAAAERSRVLDAVLAASPDVISILDRNGMILRHNAVQAGLLGDEVLPVRVDDVLAVVHPDDLDRVIAEFADLLAGRCETLSVRYRLRHRRGYWVDVRSRARVERDRDGRMVHMVVVTRAIGDELAAEAEQRRAEEAIRAADQALTEVLEQVSLRVRTPLDAVLGFAQLLEMEPLEPAAAEAVAEVLAAGRQVLALMDQVLGSAAAGVPTA